MEDNGLSIAITNLQARQWIWGGDGLFARHNDLAEEDVCVFELIKRKPVVLNVSMIRVVDYDIPAK